MWKNLWNSTGEIAKERIASALEKTSHVLNEKANQHAAAAHTTTPQQEDKKEDQSNNTSINNKAATNINTTINTPDRVIEIEEETTATNESRIIQTNRLQLSLNKFQQNLDSMVTATKKTVMDAQQHIAIHLERNSYRRDLSLPLDVEALKDAEVVYVTDRLITMGHPFMQNNAGEEEDTPIISPKRKLAAVGHLLQKRHAGKFMVWNLSEVEYDYSVLDDEVLPFQFPGSPSPPLGMLLKLLLSMESWLKADDKNVAVLHCLTGKGRTSTVLACFLCWTGEAGFHDPIQALEYIARCKRCKPDTLTIPSQRRYSNYFSNMLDGVRPHQPPIVLKRIIMSRAPQFSRQPTMKNDSTDDSDNNSNNNNSSSSNKPPLGCAPYLQIFKAGQLVFTTAASPSTSTTTPDKNALPFCLPSDGPIYFPMEQVLQGDILIRCRHLTRKGQRLSMFRAAFHTGYVATTKVLRLTKSQLDGACTDKRFDDDFFLDLIFDQCDSTMAGRHLMMSQQEEEEEAEAVEKDGSTTQDEIHDTATTTTIDASNTPPSNTQQQQHKHTHTKTHPLQHSNEAEERRQRAILSSPTATTSNKKTHKDKHVLTAAAYDSMLHQDSRFWDVIAKRRNEHFTKSAEDEDSQQYLLRGPIIGRRRDFSSSSKTETTSTSPDDKNSGSANDNSETQQKRDSDNNKSTTMDTFSIMEGNDFGLFGEDDKETKTNKKDDLMEALMAIDDDAPTSPKKDALMGALIEIDQEEEEEDTNNDNNNNIIKEGSTTDPTNNIANSETILPLAVKKEEENTHAQQKEEDTYTHNEDDDDDDDDLEDMENFLTKKQ